MERRPTRVLFHPAILRDEVLGLGAVAVGAVEQAAGLVHPRLRDGRARHSLTTASRAIGGRYATLQANAVAVGADPMPDGERAAIGATLAIGRELCHIGEYVGYLAMHFPCGPPLADGRWLATAEGVERLAQRALALLRSSLEAYAVWDMALAWHSRNALPAIDEARSALYRYLLGAARDEPGLHDETMHLLWLVHSFARIGVRAANIAAHTMFINHRA